MNTDCTIQDVFNRFYPSYASSHDVSPAQRKAAYHIMNCKTGAFGVNVSVCEDCGCISIHYNSCRDRCCPMCQEFPKEKWVDARREDLLDAPYFHIDCTVSVTLSGKESSKSFSIGGSFGKCYQLAACPNCGKY